MINLNGPVILTKPVDQDTVTFHHTSDRGAVYVNYRFSGENEQRFNLVGVGFTISGDELRLLQPPAPTAQAAGDLREIADGLDRQLDRARERGESRVPSHHVEDTRNRIRAIAASLVPVPAEVPKEEAQ